MKDADAKLIDLLRANAREPTASLARKLGLARSTVQERLARLEREGIVKGYTVRLADEAQANRLRAVVLKVDRFGNLITNIRPEDVPALFAEKSSFKITVGSKEISEIRSSFAEGGPGEVFGIIGSMDIVFGEIDR